MEITYDDFKKVQIKVGTVLEVKKNEKARKPSLVVKVDFGKEIGIKQSSAQITHYYNEENLKGKQVIGVCNFPEKNIAGIVSQILILGAMDDAIELGVTIRLISQFIATLLILGSGLWIVDIGDYFFFNTINIGIFGILLTFLCVIGLTNAINFIDGSDGLCASTVLVALCTLISYSFFFGQYENFNFVMILILSLAVFLVFNVLKHF